MELTTTVRPSAHDLPNILACHPPRPELSGFANHDAEQRPLVIGGNFGLGDLYVGLPDRPPLPLYLQHSNDLSESGRDSRSLPEVFKTVGSAWSSRPD